MVHHRETNMRMRMECAGSVACARGSHIAAETTWPANCVFTFAQAELLVRRPERTHARTATAIKARGCSRWKTCIVVQLDTSHHRNARRFAQNPFSVETLCQHQHTHPTPHIPRGAHARVPHAAVSSNTRKAVKSQGGTCMQLFLRWLQAHVRTCHALWSCLLLRVPVRQPNP